MPDEKCASCVHNKDECCELERFMRCDYEPICIDPPDDLNAYTN